MAGDAPSPPAGLTPDDDRELARIAAGLRERGLAAPALVVLECLRPAAFLGGQAMRTLTPFMALAGGGDGWDRLAQLLEVRGSVERLIAHLEGLPAAAAQREATPVSGASAYAVVDCGSTTTKAVLVARRAGRYRLCGRAEAPTTVEAPTADVMVGVRHALRALADQTGHAILDDDDRLVPPRGPDQGVGALLATSSAGGGLQMVVLGLVRSMTAASAERAALGAGAIVADIVAWNDAEAESERIERLRRLRPDMVLLAGGTDDGAVDQVVALAEQLAAAELRPRWGSGRLPVVYAGNPAAASAVGEALAAAAEVVAAPNLRPDLRTENLVPVRRVLHEVFLSHVMTQAPGYPALQTLCSAPVKPTPSGFGEALELLAAGTGGELVAVDLGGATCDVFSVHDGQVFRSVSANLGLSFSLGAVCHRAGWDQVARWLPAPAAEEELRDRVRNKMIRPTTLPQTVDDLLLEQAAAREAVRLAIVDHGQALQPLRGADQGPTGIEALVHVAPPERGIRWETVDLLVGSGGPLAHAPRREQAAAILLDACRPLGVTELAVDSVFVLPHLGALRAADAGAAAEVLDADALVILGCAVCPVNGTTPAEGRELACVRLHDVDSDEVTDAAAVTGGEVVRLPLGVGESRRLEIEPRPEWDFGQGSGRPVHRVVRGGPAGVILDGRGREIAWPGARLARHERARRWLDALGALPGKAAP